jgi:hypothetical protein
MRKQIRNNERELIIKAWASSIKDYPKLSIEEAKDICRKINITTGKEKELLREKLITGTLYVVLDFVANSILPIFEFKTFETICELLTLKIIYCNSKDLIILQKA